MTAGRGFVSMIKGSSGWAEAILMENVDLGDIVVEDDVVYCVGFRREPVGFSLTPADPLQGIRRQIRCQERGFEEVDA